MSRLSRVLVLLVLVLGSPAVLPRTAGAVPSPCRVNNLRSKQVYLGTGSNLQDAIAGAVAGDRLVIRGLCVGNFTLGRKLMLIGQPTPTYPKPTLDGNAAGTVLSVRRVAAALVDLTITNGKADTYGGGIYNLGTLTLRGTTSVVGNLANYSGGGIYNVGTLTLRDWASTRLNIGRGEGGGIYNKGTATLMDKASSKWNKADYGAGIYNHFVLNLNDSASVRGNHTRAKPLQNAQGGGLFNEFGVVTLSDTSSVSGNYADWGAGIFNRHTLKLRDDASVIHNNASAVGGGIFLSDFTSNKVKPMVCRSWTGAISPNTPDDPPRTVRLPC